MRRTSSISVGYDSSKVPDVTVLDDLLKSSPVHAWKALVTDEQLRPAIITSLELAALTVILMVVLLVPTRVWVRLRVPWMARTLEFLCLLPLTSPALVIVVGLAPVYAWVTYFLGDSALTLTFAYVVLVLPYAFRAIDAGLPSTSARCPRPRAVSARAGSP